MILFAMTYSGEEYKTIKILQQLQTLKCACCLQLGYLVGKLFYDKNQLILNTRELAMIHDYDTVMLNLRKLSNLQY